MSNPDPVAEALALQSAGRLAEAEALCRAALAAEPRHAGALLVLGIVRGQGGDLAEALALFDRTIEISPETALAHYYRGLAQSKSGRSAEAIESYGRAVALNPDLADGWLNMGELLQEAGRPSDALEAFNKVLALNSNILRGLTQRGILLAEFGRLADALADFRQAVSLAPNDPAMHANLGNVLRQLNWLDEALQAYTSALALNPEFAPAYDGRAMTWSLKSEPERALADCRQALALNPSFGMAATQRFLLSSILCDWRERTAMIADLITRIRQGQALSPWAVITALDDPELQLLAARRLASETPSCGAQHHKRTHRRLRIAYLSPDFHDHTIAHQSVELFERHDRTSFEIYGVCLLRGSPENEMRRRMMAAFDHFQPMGACSDDQIASYLRSQEIDIAVDLTGHAGNKRPRVFAFRPAPVAVNYLGYSGTMGSPHIDYILADAVVIPPGSDANFSEKIVRLPHSFFPLDTTSQRHPPPPRSESGLPQSGFVFCGFNNSYKLTPEMFDIWMRLLRQVDGSVLWLSVGNMTARANLRSEAAARQVSPGRLIFAERVADHAQHIDRLSLADLYLDSLPYNGHSTACDMLLAGVPVLTCMGRSFAARVAGSLLNAAGTQEMIAANLEAYESLALQLARSPDRLVTLRATLERNRTAAPLFDMARLTRHIEQAYETMWKRYMEGEPPEGFDVLDEAERG